MANTSSAWRSYLLEEAEWRDLQRAARADKTTVAEWVRRALRQARRSTSSKGARRKHAAILAATRHAFPAPSIEQMNRVIERGDLDARTS